MTLVLLFHLERSGATPGPVFASGWTGVDLFFVLSGFLITGILLDSRENPHRIRNFFARRVLRIFPLYYFVLVVMFTVVPLFTSDPTIIYPNEDKPFYALYVQNLFLPLIQFKEACSLYLSHTWSLAIEEQYYLVWPWLVLFLPRRLLGTLLVLILLAAPVARYLVLAEHAGSWAQYWLVYKHTLFHIDGLAIGSLLALVVRSKSVTKRALRNVSVVLTLATLPYAYWNLHWLTTEHNVLYFPYMPTSPVIGASTFSLLSIGFAGVLGIVLTQSSRLLDGLLSNRVVTWIGTVSYGLYVYHFPVFLALRTHDLSPVIVLGLTVVIAALSWYLLEKPILKLKSRFV